MTSPSPQPTSPPLPPDPSVAARIDVLRAEAHADPDPARKARLLHAIGRLLDILDANDVAAANEYLSAFQTNRGQKGALVDLIGVYERRKSATNLAKLHQVEAKSAPDAESRASALLDLSAVRGDLVGDAPGSETSLGEAMNLASTHPDVALLAELSLRSAGESTDPALLAERLRVRLETCDDVALATELTIERAELLATCGDAEGALAALRLAPARGAGGIRIALAMERIARRSKDGEGRAEALERIGDLAGSAIESAAEFEEPGIGPLLWEDSLAARAWAVGAYRAAAVVRAANGSTAERVLELYTKAIDVEPSAPFTRLERLAVARAANRDDLVAADEEALADALAESPFGAFVFHRIASRLERAGRADEAAALRIEARALAPTSAVLAAAEGAGLRDLTHAQQWFESIGADGPGATPGKLAEAAFVADELLEDYPRARDLFERALETSPSPTPLLRALYAAALVRDDAETANAALARMTGLDEPSERRRRFDRAFLAVITLDDPTPAIALGRQLLEEPTDSLAQVARAIGGLADDHALVESAHVRLAELASSPDEKAAHLSAAARAAAAGGSIERAERHANAALDALDGHAVAVAILEAILHTRNDVEGLSALARRAAIGRSGEGAEVAERARAILGATLAGNHADALVASTRLLADHADSAVAMRVARFVADETRDPGLAEAARARAIELDTPLGRATEALARARDTMVGADAFLADAKPGAELHAAHEDLAIALAHPRTAVDAAVGVAMLASPPASLVERAVVVLEEAGVKDAASWFDGGSSLGAMAADASSAGAGPNPVDAPTGQWLTAAVAAPSDAAAAKSVAKALERTAGPGALASQVVTKLREGRESDVRDDLGLLVLKAATTEGAGELAACIADVSFGPDDDASIRRAALEAGLREATPAEAPVYQARLGRLSAATSQNALAVEQLDRAVAARPGDLSAWEALRFAARDAGRHERFVEASDALAAATTGELRAEMLEDAAAVLADSLGRPKEALERAKRAMEAAPGRERAHDRTKSLLTAMRDTTGLAELASVRAESTEDLTARVKQLFEAARHLRTAGDKQAAVVPLERVLELDPGHAGALAMRAEIYVSLESFDEAVDSLRRLAAADVPVAQKRVARLGAADFLERKLGRPTEAYRELEAIDALGLADPAILQRMAKIAESEDRFDEALALHTRVTQSQAIPLRLAESERAAARIRYKWKRDPEGAVAGLRRAIALVADDVESATLLLHLVDDEEERIAVARSVDAAVRAKLVPEALSVDVLRKVLRVADMRGARDLTKLVLATLTALRCATDEERAREEDNTAIVRRVRPPTKPITEALAGLRSIGDHGAYAEISAQLFDLLVELDGLDVGRYGALRNEPLSRTDQVRTELGDLALAFGIADADVFPSPQLDSRKVVALPSERGISFVVPKGIAIPLDPALRFDAGRLAWAVAHRTLPLVQRPPDEAAAILLGALDGCDVPIGDAKSRPGVASWSKAISRVIGRKQKKAVHDLGLTLEDRGLRAEAYCRAARQSSLRAGLLVSSDLDGALSVVLGATPTFAAAASSPEAADLVCFHLSSTSLMLRRELGLAS